MGEQATYSMERLDHPGIVAGMCHEIELIERTDSHSAPTQNKIVNLHTKGAEQDILDRLRVYDIQHTVVHWYSEPMTPFNALIAYGAYFTIGVEVLHSKKIQKIARRIPDDQLLIETDNPGGWEWFHPNEPGMPIVLNPVIDQIAALRNMTHEAVIALVQTNLLRLIGDDTRLASVADFVRAR